MTMTREHVEALVARLVGKTWYVTDSTGQRWADDAPEDAARALLAALDDLDAVKKDAAAMEAQILRDRPLRENTIDDANMWKCFGVEAQSGMVQKIWEQRKSANARAEAAEAANAAMTAREGVLRAFIDDFATAKIDALRYQPSYGESPEDEPDPVVDATEVWAWQSDAKDILALKETPDA